MGLIWLILGLVWLLCAVLTLAFALLLDRFVLRRWLGRTPRALWLALIAGHAINLLLFWSPFTVDLHRLLLYVGTLVAVALLVLPLARRRARAAFLTPPV